MAFRNLSEDDGRSTVEILLDNSDNQPLDLSQRTPVEPAAAIEEPRSTTEKPPQKPTAIVKPMVRSPHRLHLQLPQYQQQQPGQPLHPIAIHPDSFQNPPHNPHLHLGIVNPPSDDGITNAITEEIYDELQQPFDNRDINNNIRQQFRHQGSTPYNRNPLPQPPRIPDGYSSPRFPRVQGNSPTTPSLQIPFTVYGSTHPTPSSSPIEEQGSTPDDPSSSQNPGGPQAHNSPPDEEISQRDYYFIGNNNDSDSEDDNFEISPQDIHEALENPSRRGTYRYWDLYLNRPVRNIRDIF